MGAYTGYRNFFSNIADERYYKYGVGRSVDDVLAIKTRARTRCRPLDHNVGAWNRLSVSLSDNTFHGEVLGKCYQRQHQAQQH